MRAHILLVTALVGAFVLSPACGDNRDADRRAGNEKPANPAAQATPSDGVRRITVSELQAALEKGEAVAIDVRGEVEYKMGHIKGALSVPLGLLSKRINELPRDKLLVTYCA